MSVVNGSAGNLGLSAILIVNLGFSKRSFVSSLRLLIRQSFSKRYFVISTFSPVTTIVVSQNKDRLEDGNENCLLRMLSREIPFPKASCNVGTTYEHLS